MKGKGLTILLCLLFVLSARIAPPVSSRVEVNATVNREGVQVSFEISGINSTIFEETLKENLIENSTIPEAIRSQIGIELMYKGTVELRNETNSIFARYSFWGPGILNRSIEGDVERYRLGAEWRKFRLDLAGDFSVDFDVLFGAPVAEWNKTDLEYFYSSSNELGEASFRLTLPSWASEVRVDADGETIVFERFVPLEERFINSPFPILVALAVAYLVALVYRRVRP